MGICVKVTGRYDSSEIFAFLALRYCLYRLFHIYPMQRATQITDM